MGFFDKIVGSSVEKRRKDAWDLAASESGGATAKLIRYLGDTDMEVRRNAVSSLEQRWISGDAVVIKKLAEVLSTSNEDDQVRAKAALAIGEYVPALADSPSGSSGEAREARKVGISALLGALKDSKGDVFHYAIVALANIEDPSTFDKIGAALGKRGVTAIWEATQAVGKLRMTDNREWLLRSIRSAGDKR
jgi:HEAT repeat protein